MRACIISLLLAGACRVAGAQGETPRWDPFLDSLQQRTIRWFLTATPGATGLTPDRWPSRSPSSIAAVGFALTIYPIAVERGIITRTEAAARTRTTLRTLLDAPQNEPQRCQDDVLLGLEVVRDHAGGAAGGPCDPHDGGLLETVPGHNATGDECDLIATLLVIDDLGHRGSAPQRVAACTAASRARICASMGEALPS